MRALAASIAVTGGMTIFSDDVPALTPEERAIVRETVALAREVDETTQRGNARAAGLLDAEIATRVGRARGRATGWSRSSTTPMTAQRVALDLAALGAADEKPEALLGSPVAQIEARPHRRAARAARRRALPAARRGRGSRCSATSTAPSRCRTSARRSRAAAAAERRAALWPRLERGELDAWSYNMELLDGLALPEAELEAFLATRSSWTRRARRSSRGANGTTCRSASSPTASTATSIGCSSSTACASATTRNRLRYESGRWRIAPGSPNRACGCGTGVCKRARIDAFRARHPGVPVVHVGNGRVSDLCAALAADIVFAKDTLAEELTARGIAFEPFATLHDVVAKLDAR